MLTDVNLRIRAGQTVGLVGASGMGGESQAHGALTASVVG